MANPYTNILIFILKFHVIFEIDFGFINHKSVYTKCFLIFPCILKCLVVNYLLFNENFPVIINIGRCGYIVAYAFYVIIFTKNNIISKVTLKCFRTDLQRIDLKLNCFSAAEYVDKKVLIALILIICIRLTRSIIFCTMTYHNCSSALVSVIITHSIIFTVESVTVINAYVFYSIYYRLFNLTSRVANCNESVFPFNNLYRMIGDMAYKYKSAFDAVVSYYNQLFHSILQSYKTYNSKIR